MKYLLVLLFLVTSTIAAQHSTQSTQGYIDMHGGKNTSLVPENSSKLGSKNMGMSNFLNSKKNNSEIKNKKIIKKNTKVEKEK